LYQIVYVVSVEEVDKMIKDQVPVDSDKQQVKVFIDNLKVDSLKIWRGDFYQAAGWKPSGQWDPEKIDELWDRIAEFTGARIWMPKRFLKPQRHCYPVCNRQRRADDRLRG